jgi:hypothetical protein
MPQLNWLVILFFSSSNPFAVASGTCERHQSTPQTSEVALQISEIITHVNLPQIPKACARDWDKALRAGMEKLTHPSLEGPNNVRHRSEEVHKQPLKDEISENELAELFRQFQRDPRLKMKFATDICAVRAYILSARLAQLGVKTQTLHFRAPVIAAINVNAEGKVDQMIDYGEPTDFTRSLRLKFEKMMAPYKAKFSIRSLPQKRCRYLNISNSLPVSI